MAEPHTHCHFCGARYAEVGWPRRCGGCSRLTFRNPIPVAVALVPVAGGGLLVIRRDLDPGRGKLALPGGYVDHGEDWRAAVVRELEEETGLESDPEGVRHVAVESAPDGTLLIFGSCAPIPAAAVAGLAPRPEVQAIEVLREPGPMAFPLHEKVVAAWFAEESSAG